MSMRGEKWPVVGFALFAAAARNVTGNETVSRISKTSVLTRKRRFDIIMLSRNELRPVQLSAFPGQTEERDDSCVCVGPDDSISLPGTLFLLPVL